MLCWQARNARSSWVSLGVSSWLVAFRHTMSYSLLIMLNIRLVLQFPIECCKTNESICWGQSWRMQSNPLSNQNPKQLHEMRENLCEQVTTGFGFTYCLRKWHKFLKPIARRSNARPKLTQIYYVGHTNKNRSVIIYQKIYSLQNSVYPFKRASQNATC